MVYKDYFDEKMRRVYSEEQAVWVKITYCDGAGVPEFSKIIKKEEEKEKERK